MAFINTAGAHGTAFCIIHVHIVAVLVFGYNLGRYSIIQDDGSVWMGAIGNVKIILLLLLDKLVFGTMLSALAWAGVAITFLAFVLHAMVMQHYAIRDIEVPGVAGSAALEIDRRSLELEENPQPSASTVSDDDGDEFIMHRGHRPLRLNIERGGESSSDFEESPSSEEAFAAASKAFAAYNWNSAIPLFAYVGCMGTMAAISP